MRGLFVGRFQPVHNGHLKALEYVFEEVKEGEPEEIIEHLKNAGSEWVNDEVPEDDVTFVVIKKK